MCTGVEIALVGSALLGAGAATYQGQQQASASKKATEQATQAAQTQATQADQAFNKANAKQPNVGALNDANAAAGAQGPGSTMLTGPLGVDPTSLTLGKTTLLGGSA